MSAFTKIISAAVIVLSFTQVSAAQGTSNSDKFNAALKYNSMAPVSVTYKSLNQQIRKLCRKQTRGIKGISRTQKYQRTCQNELMDQAVMHIQSDALLQLHASKIRTKRIRLDSKGNSKLSNSNYT